MSRAAAATFLLGAALMLAFDVTLTRVAGVLLLLGGITLGAFAIATPEFIREDDGQGALRASRASSEDPG